MSETPIDPRGGWTSASNAAADSLCVGRHLAQKGLPDIKTEYGEMGDRVHRALADGSNRSNIEALTPQERDTFEASREIEKKVQALFFGDPVVNENGERNRVFREERYWVKFFKDGKQYAHSGQADFVARRQTRALILDYKSLFGDTPKSPKNMQLRDLAVLIYGHLAPLDEIGVAIIQPFATHNPEICVYQKEDLERARIEMFDRVVASNTEGAPRTPGELQCAYCRAKFHCVEYQKFASAVVPTQMLNLMEVAIANWTPEQRARAADALPVAEKFLKDIKQFLKDGIAADPVNFCPGWKLKPGARRETIVDPQMVFNRFVAVGGELEEFMKAVTIGKQKLRDVLAKATGHKGKQLDLGMKALTEGCCEVSQNEPSLEKEDK